MAEIPIQRKKGRNLVPIVIGLLLLLGVLWWLFGRNRSDAVAGTGAAAATTTAAHGMLSSDSSAMGGARSANGTTGSSPVPNSIVVGNADAAAIPDGQSQLEHAPSLQK